MIESRKNELRNLNGQIQAAVEHTKKQNDDNQKVFDKGTLLGKLLNRMMKNDK